MTRKDLELIATLTDEKLAALSVVETVALESMIAERNAIGQTLLAEREARKNTPEEESARREAKKREIRDRLAQKGT